MDADGAGRSGAARQKVYGRLAVSAVDCDATKRGRKGGVSADCAFAHAWLAADFGSFAWYAGDYCRGRRKVFGVGETQLAEGAFDK